MNQAKKKIERFYIEEFLKILGVTDYKIEAERENPDASVIIIGRRTGIEVTEFHWDENKKDGSPSRPKEMQLLRDNKVYFAWVGSPFQALEERIKDKIKKATGYRRSDFDELWLLVVLQGVEAVGSQYAHPLYFKGEKGKSELLKLHKLLTNSSYDQAYLYFHFDKCIIRWLPGKGWEEMTYKNQSENDSSLFFWKLKSNIHFDPRSGKFLIKDEDDETAEWFKDPVGKARKEAYKAIEELRLRK